MNEFVYSVDAALLQSFVNYFVLADKPLSPTVYNVVTNACEYRGVIGKQKLLMLFSGVARALIYTMVDLKAAYCDSFSFACFLRNPGALNAEC